MKNEKLNCAPLASWPTFYHQGSWQYRSDPLIKTGKHVVVLATVMIGCRERNMGSYIPSGRVRTLIKNIGARSRITKVVLHLHPTR